MMWSDLKAVIAWFRGEHEPVSPDADPGVASLMRIVAANTMASIRRAQEQEENLPYRSDEQSDSLTTSVSAPAAPAIQKIPLEEGSSDNTDGATAPSDGQEPPREA